MTRQELKNNIIIESAKYIRHLSLEEVIILMEKDPSYFINKALKDIKGKLNDTSK